MKIRDDVLCVRDDMGTSGTIINDLDYADVISGLDLLIEAQNGATSNKSNPIERNITKIEIVDGSDVLWDLPGDVAYALYSQEYGHPGKEDYVGAGGGYPHVSIPIRFGRELYDPDLGFQPRNFKNPQLKITFNEATVRAAGATGFLSDSFNLSIVAHLMEDAPAPSGWLMAKDIYDYTTVASGDERVQMPTDYPWRQLIVRVYESGTFVLSSITNYKLSCDKAKFLPFDQHSRYVADRMQEIYPCTFKRGYSTVDDADVIQTWMALGAGLVISSHTADRIVSCSSNFPSQITVNTYTDAGVAVDGGAVRWLAQGWAPHNTMFIPFGRLNQPSEFFNAPQYGSVDLYLTNANAGAECNVCVQQLRTY